MNSCEVYSEVPSTKARGRHIKAKWLDDLRRRADGTPFVRSRLVAMDFNLFARDDVAAGTSYLFVMRLIISLANSKGPRGRRQVGLYDASVAFFHAVNDEQLYITPPPGLRRPGYFWQLWKALYGTRRAAQLWCSVGEHQVLSQHVLLASAGCYNGHPRR